MDFKVIFKDTFLEDLERIVRQIAAHNPVAAQQIVERIIRTAENLGFFPERYPTVRHRQEIRRFIVAKHYKVFYIVQHRTQTVEILRCWDGRRETDPAE